MNTGAVSVFIGATQPRKPQTEYNCSYVKVFHYVVAQCSKPHTPTRGTPQTGFLDIKTVVLK